MRYVTLALDPAGDGVHPVGRLLASEPTITRERLIHVNALSDGRGVLFYLLSGDSDAVTEALSDHDRVRSFDVYQETDDEFYVYLHVDPGQPAGFLMELVDRYALVLDTPLTFEDDGTLTVTVAGQQNLLQEAFHRIPDEIRWEVRRAGEYDPDTNGTAAELTARQHEVMQTAVELGYYEVPRRATCGDIAAELDCATSTVDEHLRKAESRLVGSIWRTPATAGSGRPAGRAGSGD